MNSFVRISQEAAGSSRRPGRRGGTEDSRVNAKGRVAVGEPFHSLGEQESMKKSNLLLLYLFSFYLANTASIKGPNLNKMKLMSFSVSDLHSTNACWCCSIKELHHDTLTWLFRFPQDNQSLEHTHACPSAPRQQNVKDNLFLIRKKNMSWAHYIAAARKVICLKRRHALKLVCSERGGTAGGPSACCSTGKTDERRRLRLTSAALSCQCFGSTTQQSAARRAKRKREVRQTLLLWQHGFHEAGCWLMTAQILHIRAQPVTFWCQGSHKNTPSSDSSAFNPPLSHSAAPKRTTFCGPGVPTHLQWSEIQILLSSGRLEPDIPFQHLK